MLTLLARVLYLHVALPIIQRREPDQVIGAADNPYLRRWYLTPWRTAYDEIPDELRTRWQRLVAALPNLYLHEILRSDDDRALHDHPWDWSSLLLNGHYVEVTHSPCRVVGGIALAGADAVVVDVERHHLVVRRHYGPGSLRGHRGEFAHRLELPPGGRVVSLLLLGRRRREWGFLCPRGWRHWREFTDPATNGATVGKGCAP